MFFHSFCAASPRGGTIVKTTRVVPHLLYWHRLYAASVQRDLREENVEQKESPRIRRRKKNHHNFMYGKKEKILCTFKELAGAKIERGTRRIISIRKGGCVCIKKKGKKEK